MEVRAKPKNILDDWGVVRRFLPRGWEDQARTLGALRRARAIPNARVLLRLLLIHLCGCSLAETAARAKLHGWCDVTAAAVFGRLRSSEEWLRWIAEGLWRRTRKLPRSLGRRVLAVDATTVCESGPTGSRWRLHYALDVAGLRCAHVELTGDEGGETLRRFPLGRGDVAMGDRIYANPPGIEHAHRAGADVLVRMSSSTLPVQTREGVPIRLLSRLRGLRPGVPRSWPVRVRGPSSVIDGRLVAIRRSAAATHAARARLRRQAAKKGKVVSPTRRKFAAYVLVFTTLPEKEFPAVRVLKWYRLRWQIELAFKRMKSILGLGQLPKHDPASCRAWLHGKLVVALLVEALLDEAAAFSPWGYPLGRARRMLAQDAVHAP
jgi:Transposase DDE domain